MNIGTASTALLPEQRLADLSALVRVLAEINGSLDPEEVFTSSLEGIQRVAGGGIRLRSPDRT